MKMKMNKNKWFCCHCGGSFKSTMFPEKCLACGSDSGNGFVAMPNEARVHGSRYTPYIGSSQWVREANAVLAEIAHANFLREEQI